MNKEVYKHILGTYGRSPGQWVGLIGEIIRTLLARVYVTYLMAQVASHIAQKDYMQAKKYILFFFIAYCVGQLIGAGAELIAVKTENIVYGSLMKVYYEKLTNKDMAFYRDNQTGYLATAFRQYLDGAILFVRFLRSDVIKVTISLIVPAFVLLFFNLKVGLVALLVVALQVVYIIWASSKINKHREKAHEIYRKITAEVSDGITNILAFKSAGKEAEAGRRFRRLIRDEVEVFWLRRKIAIILDLPRSIGTALAITIAFYFVIDESVPISESVGLIVLTITYMFQIIRNVGEVPQLMVQHDDYITKIYPTLKYLGGDYEKIKDPLRPTDIRRIKGAINVDNISFSYPAGNKSNKKVHVFKDLKFSVAAGEQIGVVGLSGAGKSTLASLLMRFDDVNSGSIKIDGVDIRDVAQSDLRQKIAYVPQEPLLFHRTVAENIGYFDNKSKLSDIKKAASAAHAKEFVEKLPDQYDSIVGERGIKLSGGQKQRIAIARAVLKRAPIMLFDEATSALDSESEKIIQKALPEILGKQTAIIIAHRLSTVAGLDRIIVMHDGKIVEEGTHAQLLKMKGRYYSLWQKQVSA